METLNIPKIADELRAVALKVQAEKLDEFYHKVISQIDESCRLAAEEGKLSYECDFVYLLLGSHVKDVCEHIKSKLLARGYGVHIHSFWTSTNQNFTIRIRCDW